MSNLTHIREGISKAWDSVTEGWRELRELAGDALTRFQPETNHDAVDTVEDQIAHRSSRWGLLAAEVTDDDSRVQVMLEVPGLDASDFEIEVHDRTLRICGAKRVVRDEVRGKYHMMERAYGRFERTIRLPAAVEEDSAKATYRAGVLTVTLRKSESAKVTRIKVESV